jgi:chromosome partitioning protein
VFTSRALISVVFIEMTGNKRYIISTSELANLVGETEEDIARAFQNQGLIGLSRKRKGVPPQLVREYLKERGVDYSFTVIANITMRGGIGKTTTAITAATRAAQYGFKTCILDLDPQASSSLAFDRIPADEDPIFYDIWKNPSDMLMASLRIIQENLSILPSSLENGLLDSSLVNPASQKNAVRGVCKELEAEGFDLVMIDCPPSLGTAVISAICAARILVIPVCSDAFSVKGLELSLNEISSICETFNLERPTIRILYTRFDRRVKMSIDALDRLSSRYRDYFIPSVIRTSTEFSKALERKETVFASTRSSAARDDYDRCVRYLLGIDRGLGISTTS